MKTISITAAMLIALSVHAYSADRPERKEIRVKAKYVLPQSSESVLFRSVEGKVNFPAPVTAPDESLSPATSDAKSFKFRNPEAITEEGLTEAAFNLRYPETVLGDPSEIVIPVKKGRVQFRNPEAITEAGLNEKAFEIQYPQVVIGDPADVKALELKLFPAGR